MTGFWIRLCFFHTQKKDLHIAASLGQPADTSALGWNKLEFVKMQGYEFGFLIDVIDTTIKG